MRYKISFLILVFTSAFFLSNCKKGKDDPLISLRTRKNRITGDWNMKSGHASLTYLGNTTAPFNQDFSFDGTKANINETETSGPPTVYIANYSLNFNIKKDGTFTLRENFNGDIMDITGHWNFLSGVGDAKNKENVVFIIESLTGGQTDQHLFNKLSTEFTYKLTELRNKEIKMESATKLYLNHNGDRTSFTSDYILTQR